MNKKLFLLLCMMSGSLMAMQEKQDNLSTGENITCAILEILMSKSLPHPVQKELKDMAVDYMNTTHHSPSDFGTLMTIAVYRMRKNK